MGKFHVTKAGRTEPCGASVRACPLGEENHYDSMQEAIDASMASGEMSEGAVEKSTRSIVAVPESEWTVSDDGETFTRDTGGGLIMEVSPRKARLEQLAKRTYARAAIGYPLTDEEQELYDNMPQEQRVEFARENLVELALDGRNDRFVDSGDDRFHRYISDEEEAELLAAENLARNAHRIYEYLDENDLANDSVVREAAFTYASEATGRDYDDFYNAWLEQEPLDAPAARSSAKAYSNNDRESYKGREDLTPAAVAAGLQEFYDADARNYAEGGTGVYKSQTAFGWLTQQASPALPEGAAKGWYVAINPNDQSQIYGVLEVIYEPGGEKYIDEWRASERWEMTRSYFPEVISAIEKKLDAGGSFRPEGDES